MAPAQTSLKMDNSTAATSTFGLHVICLLKHRRHFLDVMVFGAFKAAKFLSTNPKSKVRAFVDSMFGTELCIFTPFIPGGRIEATGSLHTHSGRSIVSHIKASNLIQANGPGAEREPERTNTWE
jgi:hypothetical protein